MQRISAAAAALVGVLVLMGCAHADVGDGSHAARGWMDLAAGATCVAGSTPECVGFGSERVLWDPATFRRAEVEAATVSAEQRGTAVDVTLSADGAQILEDLTAQLAQAGDDARLVLGVGGEMAAAVSVAQPLTGPDFQLAFASAAEAEEFVDKLERG